MLYNASVYKDARGDVLGVFAAARDVTAQKQAEEALRVANEDLEKHVRERTAELEAFTYSVSHDLRAPLRALNGFVSVLLEDYSDRLDAEGRDSLEEIRSNALRMGRLVDDLLALSRTRQAGDATALRRHDVGGEKGNWTLTSTTRGRPIDLRITNMPPATGDPALIEQVYVNLIANAVKFSAGRNPAVVEVGATEREDGVTYFVRDNGVGFDMRYADKLFEVFQRLHSANEFEGNGVGLATVERIIIRHGGQVWAQSAPDHGATFFFTLGGKSNAAVP